MSGLPIKNVAFTWQLKLVDSIDFATPETGKVATVTISKDGGVFAAADNAAVEIGFGWYEIVFTATEMNADRVAFIATAAGTAQTDENFYLGADLESLISDIKTKTDNLPSEPAAVGSEMALEDGALGGTETLITALHNIVVTDIRPAVRNIFAKLRR